VRWASCEVILAWQQANMPMDRILVFGRLESSDASWPGLFFFSMSLNRVSVCLSCQVHSI
jgi:hypothetical protein